MSSSSCSTGQKRSFTETCNLLSQYLKHKRPLPNNLHFPGAATMNLFPVKKAGTNEESNACVGKTINLFPQLSSFDSCVNKRASPEPPTPQMTIIYGGQVLVFDDLPADKAKEVMDLATSFEASHKKRKLETTSSTSIPVAGPGSAQDTKLNLIQTQNSNQSLNVVPVPPVVPNVSDLPIARKASLHRFLEKRKDRLCANSTQKLPMEAHQSAQNAKLG